MAAECLSLLVLWSSFFLSEFSLPDFSQDVPMATVKNLTCSNIRIGATNAVFNSSYWSLETTQPSDVKCTLDLDSRFGAFKLLGVAQLLPSHIAMTKSVNDACHSTGAVMNQCNLNLKVQNLKLEPPNSLLEGVLKAIRGLIEDQVKSAVCAEWLPSLAASLGEQTIIPPVSPRPLVDGATSLGDSRLARAVIKSINNIPSIGGVRLSTSLHAGTTLRLELTFPDGLYLNSDDSGAFQDILQILEKVFAIMGLDKIMVDIKQLLPVIKNGLMELDIPRPFSFSVEVVFYDFRCNMNGLNCSVPISNGITLQNIRTRNLGEYDALVTNDLGPLLVPVLNELIQYAMASGTVLNSRAYIPDIEEKEYTIVPQIAFLVPVVVVSVLLVSGTAFLSAWRYRRHIVTTWEGDPILLKRVLLEDMALISMTVLAAFGFAWSNSTSGASLVLGGEFHIMGFSLWESTTNMFNAGLYVFAVLAFGFSGVYPYIKLLTIVLCTLILQKPDMMVLKLIDFFGKFSFMDVFAMLIMMGGLQLQGVAEVKLLPGFYMFIAATDLSIFLGNYATTIWRRRTSLRKGGGPSRNSMYDTTVVVESRRVSEGEREKAKHKRWWSALFEKTVLLRLLSVAFLIGCVIPCWVTPCLSYSVKGIASVIEPEDRLMSVWRLSSMNLFYLITCIFVMGIAPFLYVLVYPDWPWLASWSAADAFLLVCVTAPPKLEQFLDYVLGDVVREFYQAQARLLWPLIPLLISCVLQWILAVEHLFGLSSRIKQCLAKWKVSQDTPPNEPLSSSQHV